MRFNCEEKVKRIEKETWSQAVKCTRTIFMHICTNVHARSLSALWLMLQAKTCPEIWEENDINKKLSRFTG